MRVDETSLKSYVRPNIDNFQPTTIKIRVSSWPYNKIEYLDHAEIIVVPTTHYLQKQQMNVKTAVNSKGLTTSAHPVVFMQNVKLLRLMRKST